MPVTAGALLTSAAVNAVLGLVCFIAFGVFRRWKVTAKLYEVKRYETGSHPLRMTACTMCKQSDRPMPSAIRCLRTSGIA
jgi:hypothetical protein